MNKIRKFILEVVSELKKVSWSTRRELLESTWIVIASSAFLGICIGIVDLALSKAMATFIR